MWSAIAWVPRHPTGYTAFLEVALYVMRVGPELADLVYLDSQQRPLQSLDIRNTRRAIRNSTLRPCELRA